MSVVTDAIAYFNRQNDLEQLTKAMQLRFGTSLVDDPDATKGTTTDSMSPAKYYRREAASNAIELGYVEKINTGVGIRIIHTLANISAQPDASFAFIDTTTKKQENIKDISQLIGEVREIGQFETTLTELDFASCMVESALLHIYFDGDQIAYDVITPDKIWFYFGSNVVMRGGVEGDAEKAVDYRKIEDASAVVVLVATGCNTGPVETNLNVEQNQYAAYIGACDGLEEGRYVVYRSKTPWPIPPVDSTNKNIIHEHMVGSTPCNPLTWLQHHGDENQQQIVTTEYPFVIWRAGYRFVTDTLVPVTTSLYSDCLELEIGFSRLLRAALEGARGKDLIRLAQGHHQFPKSLDMITLLAGDEYQNVGWPSSHARDGMDVVLKLTEQTAGGWSVPGYMVIGQLGGMNPSSGVALMIQTQPLISFRNHRIRLNKDGARRIWEIERALLAIRYPSETKGLLTPSVTQLWNAGTLAVPETRLEEIMATTQELDAKLIDFVGAVQRRYSLPDEASAIALIQRMNDRDPEFEFSFEPREEKPGVSVPEANQNGEKGEEGEEEPVEDEDNE